MTFGTVNPAVTVGSAEGWSTHEYRGEHRWSAWARSGSAQGQCATRDEAETQARSALARLKTVSRP